MELEKILAARYSVREYDGQPVDAAQLDAIGQALTRVPSAMSKYPCRVYTVTDPATLAKIALMKPGAGFLAKAGAAFVVAADTSLSEMWVEDCAIASTYILLKATDLGLGTCWLHVRGRAHDDHTTAQQYLAQALGLPQGIEVLNVVAVGHPQQPEKRKEHPAEKRRAMLAALPRQ